MNNVTSIQTAQVVAVETKRPVGRPLSEKGKRVKNAVSRYIASHGAEGFTVRDISTSTKQSKVTVNNHVNLLVQRGELVRSERKQSGGRGRPQTIFKLANVSEQSQEVVAE